MRDDGTIDGGGDGRAFLTRGLAAAVALGAIVRVVVALASIGSNDTRIWHALARSATTAGFGQAYRDDALLNHPPLPLAWAMLAYRAFGERVYAFGVMLKSPSIAADLVSVALVGAIVARRASSARAGVVAAMLLAINPTSVLLSAYHGNTDAVLALCTLLAWWLAAEGRMGLAALALAASLNVKLAPAPSVLVLLACARDPRELGRMLAAFSFGAVPFMIAGATVGPAFLGNLIGYRPPGLSWLACLGWYARSLPIVGPVGLFFASWHQRVITQATLLIAMFCVREARRHRFDPLVLGAIYWAAFLVWNGGLGFQYCAWAVPLFAAVRPRLAFAYGVGAGVYLGWAYAAARVPGWPLESSFTLIEEPVWHRALALPLGAALALLVSLLYRRSPQNPPRSKPRADRSTFLTPSA